MSSGCTRLGATSSTFRCGRVPFTSRSKSTSLRYPTPDKPSKVVRYGRGGVTLVGGRSRCEGVMCDDTWHKFLPSAQQLHQSISDQQASICSLHIVGVCPEQLCCLQVFVEICRGCPLEDRGRCQHHTAQYQESREREC